LVGGVAATLVACGEDESAAFGGIVNRFFARGYYVIRGAKEHNIGCVEIAFEDELVTIEFFDIREDAVAHRGNFEGVDNGECGFLGHNFNQGFFRAAGMDMGGQAGFCGEVDSTFDGGEGELAEDIDGLEDKCS